MTYDQLDSIADAVNPVLFVICSTSTIVSCSRDKNYIAPIQLFLVVLAVYVLMFIDKLTSLWSNFGLDYSTHSAVALALVLYLILQWRNVLLRVCLAVVLLAYYALEVYQQYHSLMDIVTTVAALLPALLLICFGVKQQTLSGRV